MQQGFATLSNGEKIHYQVANSNSEKLETIVLIHGNFSSLKWWEDIIGGLKDLGNRIIAVDLRGFGKSSYNSQCRRFGDWASDVVELLKILNVQKAILNGWSFGGAISQKVAEIAPELVSKLILTCSVSHKGHFIKDVEGKILTTQAQIIKDPKVAYSINILKEKNEAAMRQIFDMILYQKMASYPQEKKKSFALDPFEQRNYPQLLEALANSDINIELIKVKTLIIHGQEDNVLPPQTILETAEKLGKLQLWEGLGHMIPTEDTERYLSAVRAFISSE